MPRFKLFLPYLFVSIALLSCKTAKKKGAPPPPPPAPEIGVADCAQKLNLFELPPPEPLNSSALRTTKFSVENIPISGTSLVLAKILARRDDNADFVFYKACKGDECYEAILRDLAPDEDNKDGDIHLVAALDGRYTRGEFEATARSCVWADLEASPKGKSTMAYPNHGGRKFYCGESAKARFVFPGNNQNYRSLFATRLKLGDALHEDIYRFKDGLKTFQTANLPDKLKLKISNILYLRDTYNLLVDGAAFEAMAAQAVGARRAKTKAGLGLAEEAADPNACTPPEEAMAEAPPLAPEASEEQQARIKELEAQAGQARQEAAAKEAEAKAASDAQAAAQAEEEAKAASAQADQAEDELSCLQRGEGSYWVQDEDGSWACTSSPSGAYDVAYEEPTPSAAPTPPAPPAPEPSREEWRYAVGISLMAVGGFLTASYLVEPMVNKALMTRTQVAAIADLRMQMSSETGSRISPELQAKINKIQAEVSLKPHAEAGFLKKVGVYLGAAAAAPATGFRRLASRIEVPKSAMSPVYGRWDRFDEPGDWSTTRSKVDWEGPSLTRSRSAKLARYSGLLAGLAMVTMGALITSGVVGLAASPTEALEALLAKWGPQIDADKDAIVKHDASINEAIQTEARL